MIKIENNQIVIETSQNIPKGKLSPCIDANVILRQATPLIKKAVVSRINEIETTLIQTKDNIISTEHDGELRKIFTHSSNDGICIVNIEEYQILTAMLVAFGWGKQKNSAYAFDDILLNKGDISRKKKLIATLSAVVRHRRKGKKYPSLLIDVLTDLISKS